MRNILVLGMSAFIQDLEVTVLTEDVEDIDFAYATSVETATDLLDKGQWDEFLIFADFLESLDLSTIDVPVTSYATNAKGLEKMAIEGVKSYGIVSRTSELLKNIRNGSFVHLEAPEAPVREEMHTNEKVSDKSRKPPRKANTGASENLKPAERKALSETEKSKEDSIPDEEEELFWEEDMETIPLSKPPAKTEKTHEKETVRKTANDDVRSRLIEIRKQQAENLDGVFDPEPKETVPERPKKAQVITVYSAKGGVGKTTIACNLATFLALTEYGRDHFRVAVIDFDTEFGDVLSTLGFDPDKICMSAWAKDIRERIDDGEEPETIGYTQREVRSYMQKKKESGLYALIAPLTGEEAMNIGEDEIRVMLRNTAENGGFDFVVVDTSSSIRDSAVLSIEASDHVLMVLTQSLTTAHGCHGFLRMMNELGFDMSKIKTVINGIRPGKAVGITVSELEEVLLDPSTGKPFTCIGKLDDDNAVRSSANDMVPLVYQANHRFTKSIGEIAASIIGEEHVLEVPKKKKKGLGKLFRK